ncbi:MAG: nitrate reductase cytochrome c-type subunit [Rhodocyclaceae bacterium]|nr:nitrate reductase cytochrome c-type subunit [Rhodocyclaceae bacterium]MDZ4213240.1 nitrate reductase cytochrome c-type subunit [Rhodocyclaceae bacterium]
MKTAGTFKKTASLAIATLIASVIGCASTTGPTPMRGADVSAPDRAPAIKNYSEKMPGVGQPTLIARTFIGQPPMVPHTIEKYVPLTADENACLECHITDELRGQKVPKMGESHLSKTFKRTDGKPAVEMSRFQCDSCHVPQVDAKELVDSKFVGVTK